MCVPKQDKNTTLLPYRWQCGVDSVDSALSLAVIYISTLWASYEFRHVFWMPHRRFPKEVFWVWKEDPEAEPGPTGGTR